MTTYVNDTFTGSDGTLINAHTGETGATWAAGIGFTDPNVPRIFSNRLRGGTTAGSNIFFASGVATADGEYAEAVVQTITTAASFGIFARGFANSGGNARGYMAFYSSSAGVWKILRLDNTSTFTQIGSDATQALSVASHTIRVTVTGTGASVAIELKIDGSTVISTTDSTAGRITSFGSPGIYFDSTASDTAGTHIDSITAVDTAVSASIAITTPVAGRIHQRSGTTGTVTVTGTYTGTAPATIEARLVQDSTNTAVSGFDWSTKVASPSGGAYSFSFTSVPQGGWYNVQVRYSDNTAINATSGKVGVGALVALTGQSQAWLWFRNRSTSLTPNTLVRSFGNIGTWAVPDVANMSAAVAFGNALATALSIPVGVLDYAADASYLHNYSANSWLPTTNSPYTTFKNGAITGLDGKLEAVVWVQGEGDAGSSATQAQYYADLGTLISAMRTDTGQSTLPIVLVTLARILSGTVTDAQGQAVRLAQAQKCADANVYRVDRMDLALDTDNIHHTAAAFEILGTRCAQAIKYVLGAASYYRGPQIASVSKKDATNFYVNLTHNGGTDFTPTSGVTGWRVLDGSTPISVTTAVRISATKVQLTLASAPSALPSVQYLWGVTPTVTGVLKDNSALALPLEFTDGVTAQQLSATVNLVNASNAAQVSLTGLKWAWFDQVTPDLFVAPTDQGSTETTDGSGSLSVLIPNSAKTSGQIGWLVVTNSDGTTTQSPAHKAFSGPAAVD